MAWVCYKCKSTNFRKDYISKRYISINKNKYIQWDTQPPDVSERIVCDNCGIYSDRIEDIAEWKGDI